MYSFIPEIDCQPINKKDTAKRELQYDTPETQILAPVMETTSSVLGGNDNNKGRAGEPTPENIITGMLPGPTKDVVQNGMNAMNSSSQTPTLFIGGFSVLMMPMPQGGNMQQFMQTAPTFMNMLPTGR